MVSFSVVLGFLLTPLKCSPDTLKFSPMRKSFRVPIKVFSRHIKVFARLFPLKFRSSLFKGLRVQRAEPLSRSAEREIFFYGVFFLIAFSFAPAYAKEKAGIDTYAKHVCRRRRDRGMKHVSCLLAVDRTFNSHGRGEHCSPAMRHKNTFSFLVLFSDEKYQKSARRTHAVLLPNHRAACTS